MSSSLESLIDDTSNESNKTEETSDHSRHSLIKTATMRRITSQSTDISSSGSSTEQKSISSGSGHGDNRVITGKSLSGQNLYALDDLISECSISGAPQLKHAALPAGGVGGHGQGEEKRDRIRPFFDMRNYEGVPDSYHSGTEVNNYCDIDIFKHFLFTK